MTHILPLAVSAGAASLRSMLQAGKPAGPPRAVLLGALSFLGAAALGALVVLCVPDDSFGMQAVAQEETATRQAAPPAAREAADRIRPRAACEGCGVVESVTRIDNGADIAPSFLLTVRLRDGTTRTSSGGTKGGWRAGDRMMFVGGDPSP